MQSVEIKKALFAIAAGIIFFGTILYLLKSEKTPTEQNKDHSERVVKDPRYPPDTPEDIERANKMIRRLNQREPPKGGEKNYKYG